MFCENGFGMELHTVGRMFAVFERHDFPFCRLGKDFKLRGDWFMDDQRVITHPFERRGNIFEDSLSIVMDRGSLSMHEACSSVDLAAIDRAETLVPEADSEHGGFPGEGVN